MQMIHVALMGMGASTPVVAAAKAPRCYGFVVLVFSRDQSSRECRFVVLVVTPFQEMGGGIPVGSW